MWYGLDSSFISFLCVSSLIHLLFRSRPLPFSLVVSNYGVRTVLWNLILVGLLILLGSFTGHVRQHAKLGGDGEESYTSLPA